MRRLSVMLLPALLVVSLSDGVAAQTRRAPSITEAARRVPPRSSAPIGLTSRGVNLPQERQACRDERYDRYDSRDRYDRRDRYDSRDRYDGRGRYDGRDRSDTGRGQLDARNAGRGTVARSTTRDGDRSQGCGYYDDRDDRRTRGRTDHRYERYDDRNHRR